MPLSLDPDRERARKVPGGFLGLFDSPPYRDWLAWWTLAWLLIAVLSVVFPTSPTAGSSDMPVWANALISALVIGSILGLLPAYLRVLIRRRVILHRRRKASVSSEPEASSHKQSASQELSGAPTENARRAGPASGAPRIPDAKRETPPQTARQMPDPQARMPTRPTVVSIGLLPDLQSDETLKMAAARLPYPLARASRRLQLANGAMETYEATLRAGEVLSTVLGITAAAWACDRSVTTTAIDQLLVAMSTKGVSQGTWLDAGNSVERMMNGEDGLPGMASTLRRTKGRPGVHSDLKLITSERNAWAHGASPRSQSEASERLQDILPALLRALATAEGLADHDWLLVSDSQLDRRSRQFRLTTQRAMGAHPDWDRHEVVSENAAIEDSFYLSTPTGLLDLTPFAVMRLCPKCNQAEVAYADRLDSKKGVSLKTFDTGHPFFDSALVHDLEAVLGGRSAELPRSS